MLLEKRVELTGHAASIYAVCSHNDKIYSASGDKFVAAWDIIQEKQDNFAIKTEFSNYSIEYLTETNLLIIGTSTGAFYVVDVLNKQELHFIVQHTSAIFSMKENRLKNQLYVADADGNLSVWNSLTWELILFLPLLVGKIRKLLVVDQGESIYLACQDGTIRKYDTRFFNEQLVIKAHKEGVNCMAFFPNKDQVIISGGKDGFLRIWSLKTVSCVLELPAHNFGIYQILFFNQGNHFCSVSRDKSIKVWNSVDCSVIQKIERKQGGHSHAVNDVCKIDEQTLCTVGDDKRLIVWDAKF